MKRIVDLTLGSIGLVLASPVILVAALLIRLETRGPALFRQTRVGLDGKEFELLKLRTMVDGAASVGGHATHAGDPRITRVGKLLRKTSFDELPQLVNVLRTDMTLVGPRPAVPGQRAEYSLEDWERRLSVRPGITGLAQVRGRSANSPEATLSYDLEYVETHSVVGDLRICLLTIRQLVRGQAT